MAPVVRTVSVIAGLVVVTLLGVLLTEPGGQARHLGGPSKRDRLTALRAVCSWAPAQGGVATDRVTGYDLVVVDAIPGADGYRDTTSTELAALRRSGSLVLAYMSIGTVESWRRYARRVPPAWTLGPVPHWPGERYVDARRAGWRALLRREADELARIGFDGLLLDNLDVTARFPEVRRGLVRLVRELRTVDSRMLLVAQNGLSVADALPIDAIVHEDVFWRWDRGYRMSTTRETRRLTRRLRALRAHGLPVLTLDYTRPGAREAQDVVRRSRLRGFHPAVSVRNLDRPPHATPRSCGPRPSKASRR